MTTANEVVNRAMSLIGAKVAGQDLTDDEYSDSIEVMNDLMSELSSQGVNIGYQKCSVKTDDTLLPDWSVAAIKANLATRLAPEYARVIPPGLAVFATSSMNNLITRELGEISDQYPDTLPLGIENNRFSSISNYFSDSTLDDLESGVGISLETEEGTVIETED